MRGTQILILFGLLTLVLITSGCVSNTDRSAGITTKEKLTVNLPKKPLNKSALLIIAPQNFRDEEYSVTMDVLKRSGVRVTVASLKKGVAKGMLGLKVMVNNTIYDVNVSKFDAIIFIGGSGSTVFYNNQRALEIAREAYESGKVVAAICLAPGILARAGILKGKRATIWSGARDVLENAGAIYTGRDVEVDGNIVTANGPKAAEKFAITVVKLLANPPSR